MWICNRCQSRNRDGDRHCIECAAPRNARRFGASTPVEAPAVAREAPPERKAQHPPEDVPLRPAAPEERYPAIRRGRLLGGVMTAVGLVLLVALPALLVYLAVQHQSTLMPQVQGLLNPAPPAAPAAPSPLYYWGLTALATLLCATPGLCTLALGRLLVRRG